MESTTREPFQALNHMMHGSMQQPHPAQVQPPRRKRNTCRSTASALPWWRRSAPRATSTPGTIDIAWTVPNYIDDFTRPFDGSAQGKFSGTVSTSHCKERPRWFGSSPAMEETWCGRSLLSITILLPLASLPLMFPSHASAMPPSKKPVNICQLPGAQGVQQH